MFGDVHIWNWRDDWSFWHQRSKVTKIVQLKLETSSKFPIGLAVVFGAVWLFLDQVQGSLLLLQLVPTRLKDTCCQRLPHFLERICVVPEATMLQMKVVECSLMLGWFWLWHVISAFWGFVLEGSNLTAAKMSRCNLQAVSVSSVFSSRVLSSCRGDKSRTSQIHQGMFWRLGFVNMLLSF